MYYLIKKVIKIIIKRADTQAFSYVGDCVKRLRLKTFEISMLVKKNCANGFKIFF